MTEQNTKRQRGLMYGIWAFAVLFPAAAFIWRDRWVPNVIGWERWAAALLAVNFAAVGLFLWRRGMFRSKGLSLTFAGFGLTPLEMIAMSGPPQWENAASAIMVVRYVLIIAGVILMFREPRNAFMNEPPAS